MKRIILSVVFCLFVGSVCFGQSSEINVIPKPESVKMLDGKFKFNRKTKIVGIGDAGHNSAAILNDLLLKNYGFKLEYTEKPPRKNVIMLMGVQPPIGEYSLSISSKSIFIRGGEVGQFHALQTLMQILPVDFKGEAMLPAVDIYDTPRFPYRGMHLDVARHFFPVEFVKKYIDLMAQYKFNYFHWHLTDDQGWRIEIKKYPRLTEIGSKRKESAKGRVLNPYVGDGVPVEGFYTQEQIKEVVAYAKAKYITVIPEIELPGHSSAALAAYPSLGCKENYEYKVQTTWGIFKEVFCPKEETFRFLEDVLAETIALFPDSPYIHIGGDEVLKDFWKESAFVQELKAKENLKDEHEVQSYFIRRIEKFINSKGKRMIGWDEILEGGLAPNATVMSWRGMKGGIEAAKAKHDVIMTPTDFAYLDYGQGDPRTEPINIGGYLTLEKVYSFEPVPKELTEDEKKYILGGQGNVWTEYMKTPDKVEYMVFPRMLALAEAVWSRAENRNFDDFKKRIAHHFARLGKQNVNYRIPEPTGLQNFPDPVPDQTFLTFKLEPLNKNWKIFYTTDGSEPTEKSEVYDKGILIASGKGQKIEIKTIVVNEKGRKSVPYSMMYWGRELLAATTMRSEAESGVALYSTFKENFSSVGDFEKYDAETYEKTKSLGLGQFKARLSESAPFAVKFESYLNVPKDEIYEFELEADDGAALVIDGEKVVDNDGMKEKAERKTGIVPLKKGWHRFMIMYFKGQGKWALGLRWGIKGQPLRGISMNELAYSKMQ